MIHFFPLVVIFVSCNSIEKFFLKKIELIKEKNRSPETWARGCFASRHSTKVKRLLLIDALPESQLRRVSSPKVLPFGFVESLVLWVWPLGGAIFMARDRQRRMYGRLAYQNGKQIKAKLQENLVAAAFTKIKIKSEPGSWMILSIAARDRSSSHLNRECANKVGEGIEGVTFETWLCAQAAWYSISELRSPACRELV